MTGCGADSVHTGELAVHPSPPASHQRHFFGLTLTLILFIFPPPNICTKISQKVLIERYSMEL